MRKKPVYQLVMADRNGHGQGGTAAGDQDAYYSQQMVEAAEEGDEEKLREALKFVKKDINFLSPEHDESTALHIAVRKKHINIVNVLLEKKADPSIKDGRGNQYTPLHYAVRVANFEMVDALLKNGANPNAKESEFGFTPLHMLASKWDSGKDQNKFEDCLRILLSHEKIRLDATDNSRDTPLYQAAIREWEHMTKKLILKGANIESKVLQEIINEKFPDLLSTIDFTKIVKPKRFFAEELNDALRGEDLKSFRYILSEIDDNLVKTKALEEDHGGHTLLTYACENSLTDFVDELLENGANFTSKYHTKNMTPILYAARNGYHKVLKLLLEAVKALTDEEESNPQKTLRQSDEKKETALHKVVKREYADRKHVDRDYYKCLELLLSERIYFMNLINLKDGIGNTALHYAVLCDDHKYTRLLLLNGAHLGIKNNYGNLAITHIPATILEEVLNDSIEYKNKKTESEFEIILHYNMLAPARTSQQPETECLRFLSESSKHKHLLLHPIIDTFLFLKWQKIHLYFYINFFIYLLFLIFLTTYILLYYGNYTPIVEINNSNVTSKEENQGSVIDAFFKYPLGVLTFLLALYIAVREIIQFLVSWTLYVTKLVNWLEISIVILTILLFLPIGVVHKQSICAWLILFSWLDFMLLMGQIPKFNMSVYITMFTTVSLNFFRLILMFSVMLVAFSISFFLVFQMDDNFSTYPLSLLKTIAMTIGELDFSDLPIDEFPVSSHLLFVMFVFWMVLVLINLLNGLAVSDIQQIQQEAQLVSSTSMVELIYYIESVFLASPLHHILPQRFRCCEEGEEKNESYFTSCMTSSNPAIKILNKLGHHILMFPSCLSDSKISMYPNKSKVRWEICNCHKYHLKEAHIEAAKDKVLEGKPEDLSHIVNQLDELKNAIASLTDTVNNHVLCPSPRQ